MPTQEALTTMFIKRARMLPLIAAALALLAAAACGASQPELDAPQMSGNQPAAAAQPTQAAPAAPAPAAAPSNRWDSPPAMSIDESQDYRAIIELAKGGEIVIDLFEKRAPNTVNNFVFLANEGFYDSVTFHRVLENFMAQTGDPTGTGTGSAGYRFNNEFHPELRHDAPGILSMANAGLAPDGSGTNGSQFFITFVPTPFLDGINPDGSPKNCAAESCHSVFGRVIDGMDVLMSISLRNPATATTPGDAIRTIRIEQN